MKAKCTLLLLLALLVPAAAAHAGTAKVRSVSVPRTATGGMPLGVKVKVAARGRKVAAKLAFYLSSNAKRDRGDVRLKVAGGRPGLPSGQAPGTYRLIACVRKSCRTSRPFEVTATPVGTRDLLERDVAAGKLSPQQALVYRAFAAFGDRRLPARYEGDDAEPDDTVMRTVAQQWSQLSAAQQKQLSPFFLPPAAPGSWASRRAGAASSAPAAPAARCDSNQLANRDWRTLAKPGGHVRVWWLKVDERRIGPRARSFVTEIENTIWPKLVAVFGREPLKDGGQRCFHGIDDKLDIYMLRLDRKIATTVPYPPNCAGTPSYIVFEAGNHLPDNWEVAHEVTHAFQFAYRYKDTCSAHDNWDEAIATWGAEYAYPKDDSEHFYPWFLEYPFNSLIDASYDGWPFVYAVQQFHGTGPIRSIYDQTEQKDLLDAIDAGLPGGFKKTWPEFALAAWNQDPVSPNFAEWDRFKALPEQVGGKPIVAEQIDPGPTGQTVVDVPLGLKPLTRAYRRFKLGPGITQITVEKPSYADLSVQAIVHTPSGGWKTTDWFQKQPVWCPTEAKDRPDEIILVLANSSPYKESSNLSPVRLIATNIGCNKYVGEASGTVTYGSTGMSTHTEESFTVTGIVYKRALADQIQAPRFIYDLAPGAKVTWSMSGTQSGCTVKAGPVTVDVNYGQLDIRSSSSPDATWGRRYNAYLSGIPAVQGTATCPSGTHTQNFGPRASLLSTSGVLDPQKVSPSGALEGTASPWSGSDVTANYKWKLVPEE
jgi:hypothetical protein